MIRVAGTDSALPSKRTKGWLFPGSSIDFYFFRHYMYSVLYSTRLRRAPLRSAVVIPSSVPGVRPTTAS
jgi:hypothetical protein